MSPRRLVLAVLACFAALATPAAAHDPTLVTLPRTGTTTAPAAHDRGPKLVG